MLTFEGKTIFDIIHGPNVHNIFVISILRRYMCNQAERRQFMVSVNLLNR